MACDSVETIEVGTFTVRIEQDTDVQDPREDFDHVGKMVCWHGRYNLGDEQPKCSPEEYRRQLVFEIHPELEDYIENALFERMGDTAQYDDAVGDILQKILDKHYVILPCYLLDHSGITMSTGSFGDPWDSGQVGFIYCTMKKAREEWSGEKTHEHYKVLGDPDAVRKCAEKYLTGEVEEYDQYLTGDVYGYVVEDGDGENVESCWGFYGFDYCKQEGLAVGTVCEKRARESAEQKAAQQIEEAKQEIVFARHERRQMLAEWRQMLKQLGALKKGRRLNSGRKPAQYRWHPDAAACQQDFPALSLGFRQGLARCKAASAKARNRITTLEENCWESVSQ
jgi:hypothetical protein